MNTAAAFTVAQTAERLSVSTDIVRSLIRSKRLHAVNVATGKKRAKWIVPEAAIERFLSPPEPKSAATKRRAGRASFKRY